MDPKYELYDDDLDATVRNIRAFADRPGDLQFRRSIGDSFEGVTNRLGKIDVRLARIEERQLNRVTVAEMVRKEIEPLQRDYDTLSRMVWGVVGAAGTAIIGLLGWSLTRVFGH